MRERDPDGDGLLTILLPDESGLDDSPKYDAVYGPLAHWKPGLRAARPALPARALERRDDRPHHATSTSRTCWSTSPTRSRCARCTG